MWRFIRSAPLTFSWLAILLATSVYQHVLTRRELHAVLAGQPQVEHHEVDGTLVEGGHHRAAVVDRGHAQRVRAEVVLQQLAQRRVVVDHQDVRRRHRGVGFGGRHDRLAGCAMTVSL